MIKENIGGEIKLLKQFKELKMTLGGEKVSLGYYDKPLHKLIRKYVEYLYIKFTSNQDIEVRDLIVPIVSKIEEEFEKDYGYEFYEE